jgi:hypothetical protein
MLYIHTGVPAVKYKNIAWDHRSESSAAILTHVQAVGLRCQTKHFKGKDTFLYNAYLLSRKRR